jgi:ferredoxin/flavodoxin---NADP+ reductase
MYHIRLGAAAMPENNRQDTNKIIEKKQLNSIIKLMKIHAPSIAEKAKAGQFVILKTRQNSERIPLTLADWNSKEGSITLIFQEVGFSTKELGFLNVGDKLKHLAGPLGRASSVKNYGKVAIVCGGVGSAAAYPITKALKEAGNHIVTIFAARNKELFVLEDEIRAYSDEFIVITDDGSKGIKAFPNEVLKSLIAKNYNFDMVYAIGPPIMMSVINDVTKPLGLKTFVSLNPIMVDGMGMCGACRVTIGDHTKFACVDGPEFDSHQVNFKELMQRLKSFANEEKLTAIPLITMPQNQTVGDNCKCHKP